MKARGFHGVYIYNADFNYVKIPSLMQESYKIYTNYPERCLGRQLITTGFRNSVDYTTFKTRKFTFRKAKVSNFMIKS